MILLDIKGPPDSPYEKGLFQLDINIPHQYPFDPPQIRFKTPIYHPNIDESGRICADILKKGVSGGWRPSLNLSTTLISLSTLMAYPNPEDPLDADIAREFKLNYELFTKTASEHTLKHAVNGAPIDRRDSQDMQPQIVTTQPRKGLSLSHKKRKELTSITDTPIVSHFLLHEKPESVQSLAPKPMLLPESVSTLESMLTLLPVSAPEPVIETIQAPVSAPEPVKELEPKSITAPTPNQIPEQVSTLKLKPVPASTPISTPISTPMPNPMPNLTTGLGPGQGPEQILKPVPTMPVQVPTTKQTLEPTPTENLATVRALVPLLTENIFEPSNVDIDKRSIENNPPVTERVLKRSKLSLSKSKKNRV
ncbi:ubiquitin-conjugating enzyme/RWD-like protein [Spinellus fusiger]|nr:ubiquitin-conjugating enzyme/RWD-like protein [Spinellus fusiger]